MPIPPVIEGLRDRPEMFVATTSYDTVVAFLTGYDMALLGGLLLGFREWLIVRLGSGNNLSWSGLVDVAAEAAHGASLADGTRRQVLFDPEDAQEQGDRHFAEFIGAALPAAVDVLRVARRKVMATVDWDAVREVLRALGEAYKRRMLEATEAMEGAAP